MRKPFFVAALVIAAVIVLVEIGSVVIGAGSTEASSVSADLQAPGIAIPYMAVVDGLLLYAVALLGAPLIIPAGLHGKIQGVLSLCVSLGALIGAVSMILGGVALLTLMITLLTAVPFGTIVYMAKYSNFNLDLAAVSLSTLMAAKLAFAACLIVAHERFLLHKSLVLLLLTSLLSNIIVAFMHGLPPSFLASITDAIAGIVVVTLGVLWALFLLLASLPSILKAVKA